MRARVDMRSAFCVVLLLSLIIESKASLLSKRQSNRCPPDTFGPSCSEKCSVNCRPDFQGIVTCDNAHGFCENGCKNGHYGDTCNRTCGKCRTDKCDRINGFCHDGCTDGWEDPHCTERCIANCKTCTVIYPSACVECQGGYTKAGQACVRSDRGPSKATVDTVIGISFGIFVLIIVILVLVYANRTKCIGKSAPKNDDVKALQNEAMYKQDGTGSQISVELI